MPYVSTENCLETDSLDEIIAHLSPNAALFCDLDNTLIEPCQHFGTVQWGEYYTTQLLGEGKSPEEAEEIVQAYWLKLLPNIPMRLVDPDGPQFISELRQRGHKVLGLTARYPEDAPFTHPQLQQLGIQFDESYSNQAIAARHPCKFEKGIIFASALQRKSEALISTLHQLDYFPKKILFIDDKLKHVQDLTEPLAALNIDYVGIRYSKADPRVQQFDPQIAEIQMRLFPKFISDKQALQLLTS